MKCLILVFCTAFCGNLTANAQDQAGTNTLSNSAVLPPVLAPGYGSIPGGSPANSSQAKPSTVKFTYTVNYPTHVALQSASGEVSIQTQTHQKVMNGVLELDCDLDKLDLPEEAKRAAVQAVTATRHKKLLQSMKEAKTEPEKEDTAKKLEANYRAHYAAETEWRTKQLAELEKRLDEMRAQLKERAGSENKYVEAAMTLAKLHAQGIAAEPPKLNGANSQGLGPSQPQSSVMPQTYFPFMPATSSPNDPRPVPVN